MVTLSQAKGILVRGETRQTDGVSLPKSRSQFGAGRQKNGLNTSDWSLKRPFLQNHYNAKKPLGTEVPRGVVNILVCIGSLKGWPTRISYQTTGQPHP